MEIYQPNTGVVIGLPNRFDIERGLILEGRMTVRETGQRWASGGFFIEMDRRSLMGTTVLVETRGLVHIGNIFLKGYGGVPDFQPIDRKPAGLQADQQTEFRLLLRGGMMELYLDGKLVQCYSLPKKPTGRIGFVVESGRVLYEGLRAWAMSL